VRENCAIELHDSDIASVTATGGNLTVNFRPAVIHKSEGSPGVDKGSVWLQDIDLQFFDAQMSEQPSQLGAISEGSLSSSQRLHELSGSVKFVALVAHTAEQLRIEGGSAILRAVGEARDLEEFA
jgi:hypothetical protein